MSENRGRLMRFLKRLVMDVWFLLALASLFAYFSLAIATGRLPRWWGDPRGIESAMRPVLAAFAFVFAVLGTFFLSRVSDTSGTIGEGENSERHVGVLNMFRAMGFLILAIILNVFPAFTRDSPATVDRVIASGTELVALSNSGKTVWTEPFDSQIMKAIGPTDLDGDGNLEVVIATHPTRVIGDQRDGPASRLLILDSQTRRIRFDSRYVLLSEREGSALSQVPYEDIRLDPSGEPESVVDHEGESAEIQVRSDLYGAWSCDYPISQSHVGYEITDVRATDLSKSGETQIVFAANPLHRGGVSLIGVLSAEGSLLGAYCHRGSILDVRVISPEHPLDDRVALVVLAENDALAEEGRIVNSIFALRGVELMEPFVTNCWNMVTRSDFEDPASRGTGCSLYQPAQLWYVWLFRTVEAIQANLYSVYGGKTTGFSSPTWWVDVWLADGCEMSISLGQDPETAEIVPVSQQSCGPSELQGVDDFNE